ncbi:zinc finger protein ZFAT [Anopheles nili]|uniref:zinc finger protein ZFAT n=1 Tax=Anopheles nili TaxID=185578 RepID=UPI00237B87F8|nr:zinc finger protein ZFAT [Anopheles nili]
MLHEEDTELDDTHLCIKCGGTVVGIENYIKHRKANCAQPNAARSSGEGSGDGAVTEPIGNTDQRNADGTTTEPAPEPPAPYGTFDFTETIKEQPEHHKKVPSYGYHNYELESHHHHHHHHHHRADKSEVNYEYELGADLFFSSLELQSSSKPRTSASATTPTASVPPPSLPPVTSGTPQSGPGTSGTAAKPKPKTRKGSAPEQEHPDHPLPDDWLAAPNESDKLLKAVSDISGHKKVDLYPIFHQESPDPSEEDSDEEEDYDAPPRTHTGGKWKPENRPSAAQWRHWRPEPLEKPDPEPAEDEECFKSFSPPPGHTRGKWVPGSKITRLEYKPTHEPTRTFADNYWCSICNRRLASRVVYERHLRSNLHLKRAQEESELERAIRPLYANELSKQLTRPRPPATTVDDPPGRVKRHRKCYYTRCVVCQTRLPTHLLGKHLISRYHYRRMLNHPERTFDIVLRNMHRIVLQSPFQCGPCRFYANTEAHFMTHWRSPEHVARAATGSGNFWCSFCKFECEGNFQMTEHLQGANHREVIAVINRSVPIIIRKITRIRCECCGQEFRYNAELRRHQRLHCVAVSEEAQDQVRTKVQNTFACELCSATFPNRMRLLQHGQKLHRLAHYYCSICECSFGTAQESLRHRRTTRHKVMSARKRSMGSKAIGLLPKKCSVCGVQVSDVLELKQHIESEHPEVRYSCPRCGECFVLPQELGRHVRDKNCTFFNSSTSPETPPFPRPCATTDVLSNTAPSPSSASSRTRHQDTPTAVALPAVETSPPAPSSSSSATGPHLPGTNSIISNDSIKVNMNDRKLGKETHLYSSEATATAAAFLSSLDRESSAEPDSPPVRASLRTGTADEPAKVDMMENYSPASSPPTAHSPASPVGSSFGIKLEVSSHGRPPSGSPASPPPPPLSPVRQFRHPSGGPSPVVSNSDCDNIVAARSPQASAEIFFAMANNASENNTVYVDEIVGTIGEDDSVVCWQCKICPFSTPSQAEFLFHEILHSSKLDDKAKSSPSDRPGTAPVRQRPKITCPLCGKPFSRASLRCHLRQHTDERLYPCPDCPMAFTRKANLKNHTDNIHRKPAPSEGPDGLGQGSEVAGPSTARTVCTTCGKTFANRYIMQQHSKVHHEQRSVKEFSCQYEGCHYLARSAAETRRHLQSHSDERSFACDDEGCDYRGKSLAQLRRHALYRHEDLKKKYRCDQCDFASHIPGHLRRHLLVHSGSKPFACPHCDYSCNNIENLRKHVISTSKHKGKFLYECKFCPRSSEEASYGTNFQKEYRAHLQDVHKLTAEELKSASISLANV